MEALKQRTQIQRYFDLPAASDLGLLLLGILWIGSVCLYRLLALYNIGLSDILDGTEWGSLPLDVLELLLGGILVYVPVRRWRDFDRQASDTDVDVALARDLGRLKHRALKALQLDATELIAEPVVLCGPRMEDTGGATLAARRGADGLVRFTPVDATVIHFTAHQLFTYQGALDLTTGGLLNPNAGEYFYEDIVSMTVQGQSVAIQRRSWLSWLYASRLFLPVLWGVSLGFLRLRYDYYAHHALFESYSFAGVIVLIAAVLPLLWREQQRTMQYELSDTFRLTTRAGTSLQVSLADSRVVTQAGGGELPAGRTGHSLRTIRRMLREKKAPASLLVQEPAAPEVPTGLAALEVAALADLQAAIGHALAGDTGPAIALLERALATAALTDWEEARAQLCLAQCLLQRGDTEAAHAALRCVILWNLPDTEVAPYHACVLSLCEVLQERGDLSAAVALLEPACERGADPALTRHLATLLFLAAQEQRTRGNLADAWPLYARAALHFNHDDPQDLEGIAQIDAALAARQHLRTRRLQRSIGAVAGAAGLLALSTLSPLGGTLTVTSGERADLQLSKKDSWRFTYSAENATTLTTTRRHHLLALFTVEVHKRGFEPFRQELRVLPGNRVLPVTLKPHTATLQVDAAPLVADVTITSEFGDVRCKTPCKVEAPARPVKVVVKVPGYTAYEREITIQAGRTTDLGTILFEGGLEIDSDPSGALVLLDGKERGTTPLRLGKLPAKTTVVTLRKPFYADLRQDIAIHAMEVHHGDKLIMAFEAEAKRQVVRARGLVWERVAPAQRLDFVAATKRCTELKLGPWQWRLPEGAELAQIYEKRDGSACQWGAEGVAYEGPCGAYWSHAPLDPSQASQVDFSPNAAGPAGQPGAVPAEDLARPRALRCVTTLTTMTEKAVKLLEKVPRLEKAPRQREHKVKRKPGRHGKRR